MKDWHNIYKSDERYDYQKFLGSLPCYRVISTIKNKNCTNEKCNGNHKMVLRYMKCTSATSTNS